MTRTLAILAGQARAHSLDRRALLRRGDLPCARVTGAAAGRVKEGIAVP